MVARRRRKKLILLGVGIVVLFTFALLQVVIQPDISAAGDLWADADVCRLFGADLRWADCAGFCFVADADQAVRGAADGRARLEVPHQDGDGRAAAVGGAGDCAVSFFLRADEPLDRQVVFASGGGGARAYGGGDAAFDQLRRPECGERSAKHCRGAGDGAGVPDGQVRSADERAAQARGDAAGRVCDRAAGRTGASQLPGSGPVADLDAGRFR